MTMNEYQELAQRTARKELCQEAHLMNGILGLSGETGECADLVKKHYYQDGRDIEHQLFDECGDVLWYLVEVVAAMGWTLDDVAENNVEKLMRRYPQGFDPERSLHREGK